MPDRTLSVQPSITIPTAVGVSNQLNRLNSKATGLEDLDFHIGHDALANSATYSVSYPVRHGMVSLPTHVLDVDCRQASMNLICCAYIDLHSVGEAAFKPVTGLYTHCLCVQVDNWDHMERFYQHCIMK